ncbi:MAG: FtsB family cell division protein [Armatimonadota bacterium]
MADNIAPSRSARRNAKRSRRRKPGRARLMRLLTAILIIAIVASISWMIIVKITRPYRIAYIESKDITEIKNQITEAERENKALKDDLAYISRPEGKMVEARRLGYVKEGEIAVVLEQPDRKKYEMDQMPRPPVKKTLFQSIGSRILQFFGKYEGTE